MALGPTPGRALRGLRLRGTYPGTHLGRRASAPRGLILFSVMLAAAQLIHGNGGAEVLLRGAWELGGTALLGLAIGAPMAYLTGHVQPGEPKQAEALGLGRRLLRSTPHRLSGGGWARR
ncbi:MAG: hypothetical protein GWN84_11675 [Gammaproteobacteria bacterium]|nr:hypothetical protein [Gammaproteobacteria bacterium]NIR83526.1 hypothetical protein [Gammaproteobacteria bacterium]NIR91448.1 hypothetical protein [Gammaproteobacteria bacterium]NIU04688.1 hypothetical protein [Gammaproteobacteria bacterium]NIV51730.1 hypothetical protein [Gammaproteobacteria bacterium]